MKKNEQPLNIKKKKNRDKSSDNILSKNQESRYYMIQFI